MGAEKRQLASLYRLTHLLAMGTPGASLLRTIVKQALGLTRGHSGRVLLLKPDRRTLQVAVAEGQAAVEGQELAADTSPWSEAIREGKLVRLPAPQADAGPRSAGRTLTLGLPLLARGDVLGLLVLERVPEAWARPDCQVGLQALADLAAHVLDNGALYRDLLRQKEELCTLIEVGRDITASLDLAEVLRRVVRHASRLLQATAASLLLLDDDGGPLRLRAAYGMGHRWQDGAALDAAHSVVGEVLNSGAPLALLDIRALAGDPLTQLAGREGLRSLLCVPMKTSRRCVGALTVYTVALRRFRAGDVELLAALASQSAIAIENARLYRAMLETREQLRQSERLAALGGLAAGLAHEIRNPLHTMLLLASAMQQDGARLPTLSADLAVMRNEIERLALLVEQFLDVARPKPPDVSPQRLPEIMEETVLLVSAEARRRGVRIRKSWPRDLPLVWVDGAQIKQVFLNVLLNALQAAPAGSAVEVRMEADGAAIATDIQDRGGGIPEAVQAHLFTPFFTTKPRGLGLGLSISQRLIAGHRGTIRVISREGEGTTVRIVLPVAPGKVDEKDPPRR
jgi:signal transduction histidine kinase